jgi:hypothetical protein
LGLIPSALPRLGIQFNELIHNVLISRRCGRRLLGFPWIDPLGGQCPILTDNLTGGNDLTIVARLGCQFTKAADRSGNPFAVKLETGLKGLGTSRTDQQ